MSVIAPAPSPEREDRAEVVRAHLSVGHAVLLAIGILAAIMHFSDLNALPLAPQEAERALAVWRFWQPEPPELAPGVSPAYFSLTAILMPILGHGDVIARLIPALFGVLLVFIPWLWRNRLGTFGALTASILLAASPTVNVISRTAGGDSLALAATLLLFVGWMRYQENRERLWLSTTLAALGLGLASSPLFYGGLVTLGAAWLIQVRLGPRLEGPSGDGRGLFWNALLPAVTAGALLFLALSTMFLWRPPGLGAAVTQAAQWIGRLALPSDLGALLAPLLALGRYELIVATLGLAAIAWASWRGVPAGLFLVTWFTAGIVLILLQQGTVANVAFLLLPGSLLIGLWFDHAFRENMNRTGWLLLLLVLALGTAAYVNGARYLRVMTFDPRQVNFLLLAFVAIASVAVAVNFVRSFDPRAALQGSLAGIFLLLLAYGWGTAWWMGQDGANDPRERWVTAGTDDDVRLLAEVLSEISWEATGNAHELEVLAGLESPLLGWYLREFDNLQMGQTVPAGADTAAIITAEEVNPRLGDSYFGSDFALLQTGATLPQISSTGLSQTLRWWVFHEHPAVIDRERIVLWVRNDGVEE